MREKIPSLSSVSSKEELYHAFGEAFKEIRRRFAKRSTLSCGKVPPIFREPYIMSGYRPIGRSFAYYLRSFFMLHNESMNVWTHFFGTFLIMRLAANFYDDFKSTLPYDVSLVLIFAACSVLIHLVSAFAHLVHNHSERTHCYAFYFDNAAVGISAAGINLLQFCYVTPQKDFVIMKDWYLSILIIGSIALSTGVSYALAKYRRKYDWKTQVCMFGPTGVYFLLGCLPFFLKLYRFICGEQYIDCQWYFLHSLWIFAIAASLYASCFPENQVPGQFDIFGHSHQLFHFLITISHAAIINAVRNDVEFKNQGLDLRRGTVLTIDDILSSFSTIIVLDLSVILFLVIKFRNHFRN